MPLRKRNGIAAACAAVATLCAGTVAAYELTVSSSSDVKTLAAARDRIRETRKAGELKPEEKATVTIAPGTYEVRDVLTLGTDDGGVVYRAAERGSVFLSGGAKLDPKTFLPVDDAVLRARLPEKARDAVRVADVSIILPGTLDPWPAACKVPPGPWLYVDGGIKPVARWPNLDARGGWTNFTQAVDRGTADPKASDPAKRLKRAGSFAFDAPRVATWNFEAGVWLYGYWTHDWYDEYLKAKSWIATSTNRVLALEGIHTYGIAGANTWGAANRRFFALNLFEELDEPGEWWLDRRTKRLYVWPTEGWDQSDVRLAVLDKPFIIAKGAEDIRFENLEFEYGHAIDFAVDVENCEDIVFDGCRFRNLGGSGVKMTGGARCRILRGELRNLGSTAVQLNGGDRKKLTRGDHAVEGCHIRDYARFCRTYRPAVSVGGVGQTVRNCRIRNAPHNAILFSGNEHLFEGNDIARVVCETSDAGAIYAGRDPTSLGTVIRGNYIHDLGKDPQFAKSKWGGYTHGIYLDDCAWGISMISNVIARCGGSGVFIGGGNLHDVRGNVFVECSTGTYIDSRGWTWQTINGAFKKPENHASWWHEAFAKRGFDWKTPPWSAHYPKVAEVLAGEPHFPKVLPVLDNVFAGCGKNHHFDADARRLKDVMPFQGNRYFSNTVDALAADIPGLDEKIRMTLDSKSVDRIQRTMRILEESTFGTPATVRVLFYGQSIVQQGWNKQVMAEWKSRYPSVTFECENRAIGGFESPALSRTAESDLFPFYPDILFFHVYGPLEKYEEIVRRTREKTTADIVLWTSHLRRSEDPADKLAKRDARSQSIRMIADKYGCAVVDLNRKWSEMLLARGWESGDLLTDNIHMKRATAALDYYADCIEEDLVRIPHGKDNPLSGTITRIPADSPTVKRDADGALSLCFTGNRVIAVSDGTGNGTCRLLLDGKEPASFPELFENTRPSKGPGNSWMPLVKRIPVSANPVAEDWKLEYLPEVTSNVFHYAVTGSVTGYDGDGWSTNRFVSKSGRVTIEASGFMMWQHNYFKVVPKAGFGCTWKTYPLYTDPYVATSVGVRTMLVQGCENCPHVLEIRPEAGGAAGIGEFIVYTPRATEQVADGN